MKKMKEVWIRRCSSFEEEEADFEFWSSLTPDERVEALEQMRAEAWKVTGERFERLQRVIHRAQLGDSESDL